MFKKITILLLCTMCVLISGCESPIMDFPNYDVVIQLEDPQGNNLALPENSQILEGTVLEFDGKTFPLDLNPSPKMRSWGPPIDNGFRVTDYSNLGYCLVYGELSGERDFKNEPFRIVWPDQSTDEIRLTAKFNFRVTSRKVKWQLNGKSYDDWPIKIVKDFPIPANVQKAGIGNRLELQPGS